MSLDKELIGTLLELCAVGAGPRVHKVDRHVHVVEHTLEHLMKPTSLSGLHDCDQVRIELVEDGAVGIEVGPVHKKHGVGEVKLGAQNELLDRV